LWLYYGKLVEKNGGDDDDDDDDDDDIPNRDNNTIRLQNSEKYDGTELRNHSARRSSSRGAVI
jgi:hypothetical protein